MTYHVPPPKGLQWLLNEKATMIRNGLPEGWAFTLLLFTPGKQGLPGEGDEGATFYISNADRADMIKALEEFIANAKADA